MQSLWIGAAGLHAGQLYLDITAHNMANVNTTGYRARRPVFRDELSVRLVRPAVTTAKGLPLEGTGVSLDAVLPSRAVGPLQVTGDAHHLAIEGRGFFPVRVAAGSGTWEILYTRDGAFQRDAEGHLVGPDGALLVDEDGNEVVIPDWVEDLQVDTRGIITGRSSERSATVAGLALALFPNSSGLESRNQGLLAETPASGAPTFVTPGEDGAGTLRQRALEGSNVSLADEMANLLLAQRGFQLNARAVRTADEMMALANRLKG